MRFALVSHIFSFVVIAIGCSALFGWIFDNATLKGIVPGLIAMNPMTAILFVLSAISLFLWRKGQTSQTARLYARLTAALVLLIAVIKFFSFFGVDLKIDQLFFTEALNRMTPVNRMAPNTTFNFILVGIALLILDRRTHRGRMPAQYASTLSLFIAFMAILGYIYQANYLYGVGSYIPMALNTAIAFLLLNISILFSHPTYGFTGILVSEDAGGDMARDLLPWGLEIPSILGYLRLLGERANLYDAQLGVTLFIVTIILLFVIIILRYAAMVDRIDRQQKKYIQELEAVHHLREEDNLRMHVLVEHLPDAVALVRPSGKIMALNEPLIELLSADEPKTITELFKPSQPLKTAELLSQLGVRPAKRLSKPFVHQLSDGSTISLIVTTTPMRHADEPPFAIMLTVKKQTEQKSSQ